MRRSPLYYVLMALLLGAVLWAVVIGVLLASGASSQEVRLGLGWANQGPTTDEPERFVRMGSSGGMSGIYGVTLTTESVYGRLTTQPAVVHVWDREGADERHTPNSRFDFRPKGARGRLQITCLTAGYRPTDWSAVGGGACMYSGGAHDFFGATPMHVPVLEARLSPDVLEMALDSDWTLRPTCQAQAALQFVGDGLTVLKRAAGVEPGEHAGTDVFWPLACSLEVGVQF